MKLVLNRKWFDDDCTEGELSINGVFECYTLEDVVRAAGIKVPGATAIPYGTYKVIIDHSDRFKRDMPHILNVPNFVGIRFHAGNVDEDTEGCILLGQERETDRIDNSKLAFDAFFPKLKEALDNGEVVTLVIKKDGDPEPDVEPKTPEDVADTPPAVTLPSTDIISQIIKLLLSLLGK